MSTIIISGAIDDALFARFVQEFQKCTEAPINIIMNSQGGDEHAGRAIAGFIKASGRHVDTYGFGDIHSAAVLIFAAGHSRKLSKAATVLCHESSAEVDGNSTAIKVAAKEMERSEQFWCGLLQDYTGTDAKAWMKVHEAETYLHPEDALKLNLATELI